jgi:hypothetical protein
VITTHNYGSLMHSLIQGQVKKPTSVWSLRESEPGASAATALYQGSSPAQLFQELQFFQPEARAPAWQERVVMVERLTTEVER